MKLQTKLIAVICSLLLVVIVLLSFLFQHMLARTLKEQIGMRALNVAETVAASPAVKSAFQKAEPERHLQPLAEMIRRKTGAEYVVIGNKAGIRYSHPIPERIGKKMVGGDNRKVLQGKSIISEAVGSLGPAIRGKAPVFAENGETIGVVSVGFLIKDIEEIVWSYNVKIFFFSILALLLGVIGAIVIAQTVKRSIHGLEPKEIGLLYQEKQAILEAIREGIIAVNQDGIVTMVNKAAMAILDCQTEHSVLGQPILHIIPHSRLLEVIQTGKAEYDVEMVIGGQSVIVNRIPIMDKKGVVIGAVSTFRNKSELYRLTKELSQIKSYAEALRAQTHEFSNKLYVISGLIQLESYEEALELITKETNLQQDLVHFVMKEIPDPMLGGLLIGKFNRANELKIQLAIDRQSSFRDIPLHMDRDHLITIIGNVIDNAMEAVIENERPEKRITVFLTDLGDDLIIEIEDTGVGMTEDVREKMFERGFSTKAAAHRGYGLDLVQRSLKLLHGYMTIQTEAGKGTLCTIVIPKRGEARDVDEDSNSRINCRR
ncbi:sensory box protein [Anoxybacillus sp. B7M1]|jgi:two-component system, CitB family, sensor kinase|uniref:ATP-binding protein n=1 Tax=unclassified Anoxybacillus TaxID=2639704 RepID=UPI0005CCD1A3|nr:MULTISPECIES: sensor histidine kinase [unclassified Anoxybacillus]ANB56533.1 sensory box protein [Anoxybacillus sp. B2M1]ANB62531.1 sensory box protein [Anoxybacillus sp. B7M1]